jgi:short-subunit dehydrogenase
LGRVALITGASAGIGKAFAEVLAARGYNLVLTARRADRLHALARDLSARHGVTSSVIAADLADRAAPARIVGELAETGLKIDLLVNNAGYGVPGAYAATRWAHQDAMVQVMVTALSELTHRLLPGMIERRWGRVINVASVAGQMPAVAGHTLYAASKSFVIQFSQALAQEVRRHGVHVTALCPGFTLSEFHDVTGTRAQVSHLPSFLWMDADTVARQGYDAVMRGDVIYTNGRINRAMVLAARMLPQRLVYALMGRNAAKFRKL